MRGQGAGGYQDHVRFTRGETHYIFYRGQNGELTESPGQTYSGISVQAGRGGERTLATLNCSGKLLISGNLADAISERAPPDLDLAEVEGGPFDAWF